MKKMLKYFTLQSWFPAVLALALSVAGLADVSVLLGGVQKPFPIDDCTHTNLQVWNKLDKEVDLKVERVDAQGKTTHTTLVSGFRLGSGQAMTNRVQDLLNAEKIKERVFPVTLKFSFTISTDTVKSGVLQVVKRSWLVNYDPQLHQSLYMRIGVNPDKKGDYIFGPQTGPGMGKVTAFVKGKKPLTESGCPVSEGLVVRPAA
jgi:hypothetical protein